MKNLALIKKYSQGIVDALKDEEEYTTVEGELSRFFSFLSSHKKLQDILYRPFLPRSKKIQLMKEIMAEGKLHEKTKRVVNILTENDRLELLPGIIEFIPLLWTEKRGVFTYEVFSAVSMSETQKKKLKDKLESLEKGPVSLTFLVDPELLGGISLRKRNIIYDISLSGHLAKLREKIIKG